MISYFSIVNVKILSLLKTGGKQKSMGFLINEDLVSIIFK